MKNLKLSMLKHSATRKSKTTNVEILHSYNGSSRMGNKPVEFFITICAEGKSYTLTIPKDEAVYLAGYINEQIKF